MTIKCTPFNSRSPILVPIKSPCDSLLVIIILTCIISRTVSKYGNLRLIRLNLRFRQGRVPLFNTLVRGELLNSGPRNSVLKKLETSLYGTIFWQLDDYFIFITIHAFDRQTYRIAIAIPCVAFTVQRCKASWSGTPCRTTSAVSRTMSALDSAWKPGFSLATSVLSALETSWQLRYINSHLPLPLPLHAAVPINQS